MLENPYHEKVAADLHVIGVRNGWFLVEDADYPDNDFPKRPSVYGGRGWVRGKLLTAQFHGLTIKAAPDENAADVAERGDDYGITAFLDCKGDWVRPARLDATALRQPKNHMRRLRVGRQERFDRTSQS